ncbi:MAG: ABC transporter ATP-binding protein [Planctomycetes bacterium]|nr:ABC transporter ATP-binding protein [Planctomycetota bacterium]
MSLGPASGPAAGAAPLISVTELHKSYGATRAVDGVSFQVARGQIRGFLGPNGAGKSTTIKIITGYLAADAGSVRVAGIDVAEEPIEARKRIGYLPESLPLYQEMRVDEYLQFIAKSRRMERRGAAQRIAEVMALLGLERMKKRLTGSLSKGYRQRLGLAQAILHDPDILILDEPTNGLDPQQIIEIRALLVRLAATKAILFSTHILQEISAVCSQIMIIRDGRLVADGTPAELAAAPGSERDWEIVISGTEEMPYADLDALGIGTPAGSDLAEGGRVYRFRRASELDIAVLGGRVTRTGRRLIEARRATRTLEQVYLELMGVGAKGAA